MTQNNEKLSAPATNPKIEYLGLWGFALIWLKVFALTGVVVLILKYIFKVPFTF